jgi:hypothetical protein
MFEKRDTVITDKELLLKTLMTNDIDVVPRSTDETSTLVAQYNEILARVMLHGEDVSTTVLNPFEQESC